MFLEIKMASFFLKGIIIVVLVGVAATLVLYNAKLIDVCPLKQVYITESIKKYEETKDPAYGGEHVPRPQAGKRSRVAVLLDLPAARPAGFWCHHESGRDAARRLQVQQHA